MPSSSAPDLPAPERGLRLATALCGVLAAIVVARGLDFGELPAVTRWRDDAYYYFAFARNLAERGAPEVSAGATTSGVHPLWALVLAGAAALGAGAHLPWIAQGLGLVLHAGTALGLGLLLGRNRLGFCGGLLYLATPAALAEAQSGQETALACAALLGLVAAAWHGRWVLLAALVAALARSDLVPIAAGVLVMAIRPWWRGACLALVPPLAVAAFGMLTTGRPLQDSAAPLPWLFWQHFEAGQPGAAERLHHLWWWLRPVLLGTPYEHGGVLPMAGWVAAAVAPWVGARWRLWPLVIVGAAGIAGAHDLLVPVSAAFALRALPRWDAAGPRFRVLRGALVGAVVLVFVHHVVRLYPRHYYFVTLAVPAVLAFGLMLATRPRAAPLLVLAILAARAVDPRAARPAEPWQEEMMMAGRFLARVLPAGEKVGAFNSGIVSWHHAGPVLNLDGKVDARAFAALRAGDLSGWLDREGVRFVLDFPVQFTVPEPWPRGWPHASGAHFGQDFAPARDLREVARFDVPQADAGVPGTEAFVLYWRVGRGTPPQDGPALGDLGPAGGGDRYVLWRGAAGQKLQARSASGAEPAVTLADGRDGTALILRVAACGPETVVAATGGGLAPVRWHR